jgi:dTDP-4-amino-4,6-dideoxygalactose transaminase
VQRRTEIAKRYTQTIKNLSGLHPPFVPSNVRHSFYKYMVLCDEDVNRDELRAKLKERGVSTSLQYDPLVHQLTYYKKLGFKDGTCPIAESMAKRIFSLPHFNQMTNEEVEHVCQALEEVIGKK